MKSYVGVMDSDWFELLRSQPHLEEVNFWQPGGSRQFRALRPECQRTLAAGLTCLLPMTGTMLTLP